MTEYYGIWDAEDGEWTLVTSATSKEDFIDWLYEFGLLFKNRSHEEIDAAFEEQGQYIKPCSVTPVHQ